MIGIGKTTMIIDRALDEAIIKPTHYHQVCYGGSTILMVDLFTESPDFQCRYQGKKNWLTKACEKCTGLHQDEKEISAKDGMINSRLRDLADTIKSEINRE